MFWVYILECVDDASWYIGYTSDLKRRLVEHQTKHGARTTRRERTLEADLL